MKTIMLSASSNEWWIKEDGEENFGEQEAVFMSDYEKLEEICNSLEEFVINCSEGYCGIHGQTARDLLEKLSEIARL